MIKPQRTKQKAPRNRTITLTDAEMKRLRKRLIKLNSPVIVEEIENRIIYQDVFETLDYLPSRFVDLVFVDPPYNLNKTFNLTSFREMESDKYERWLDSWMGRMVRLLKPTASVYICGDWKSSGAVFNGELRGTGKTALRRSGSAPCRKTIALTLTR